jgi:hypothetical protein
LCLSGAGPGSGEHHNSLCLNSSIFYLSYFAAESTS